MKSLKITDGTVLLDDEDYSWVSKHDWAVNRKNGYAMLMINGKNTLLLHRAIIKAKDGQIVDHANGDKLDNRKSNLRFCSNSQNQMNRRTNKDSATGYKGVDKIRRKFRARIKFDNKVTHLGTFTSSKEAAIAYNKKAKEVFGEYARLNVIE